MRLDEFLELPRPGWPGRRRAIVLELLKMLLEGIVFLLVIGVFLATSWSRRPRWRRRRSEPRPRHDDRRSPRPRLAPDVEPRRPSRHRV
jgi:hypothetical protein